MTVPVRIATWNVNSLRVRLPQLGEWLAGSQPDIVALQETKSPDPDFPAEALQALGYHAAFSGQKTYNGVAVLARQPLTADVVDIPGFTDPQRRVLATTVPLASGAALPSCFPACGRSGSTGSVRRPWSPGSITASIAFAMLACTAS